MRAVPRKVCRECKASKEVTTRNFRKMAPKRSRDGYSHCCRVCERQYMREYYELMKEINKPAREAYYQRNRERRIEYHKRWVATPRGRAIQQAAWRRYARFKRLTAKSSNP